MWSRSRTSTYPSHKTHTALRSFRGLGEDSEEPNRPSEVTHPHLGQLQFISVGVWIFKTIFNNNILKVDGLL